MRRITTSIVTLCMFILATSAWGQSPHYLKLNTSINSDSCYVVDLKEAGLGTASSITYTLSANAVFQAQCFTRNGNPVEGTVKQGSGSATSITTIQANHGQTTGTVLLCPAAFTVSFPGCTGNQVQKLISASYTKVTLNDGLETSTGFTSLSGGNLPDLSKP